MIRKNKLILLTFLISVVLCCCGCIGNYSNNTTITTPTPTPESYLKDIIIQPLENNTTKIVLMYEFPGSGYNVTVLNYTVQGKTVQILTRITRSNETALPIVTQKNVTLIVDGNVTMVIVMDILPPKKK